MSRSGLDGYANTPDAEAFPVGGRPGDLTPMIDVRTKLVWAKWGEMMLFAVNMYVMGGEDVYTLPEYKAWLGETGYRDVRTFDTKRSHSPVSWSPSSCVPSEQLNGAISSGA